MSSSISSGRTRGPTTALANRHSKEHGANTEPGNVVRQFKGVLEGAVDAKLKDVVDASLKDVVDASLEDVVDAKLEDVVDAVDSKH